MAFTYLTRTATTTNTVGHSYSTDGIFDTYAYTRFYTSFATSTITSILDDITSVTFNVKVTSVTGTNTYRLRSDDGTDNWGTSLSADAADFDSTDTYDEGSLSIGSTGWKSWSVDKNNLDLSGTTWYRLASCCEEEQSIKVITIASQNNATASNRPYLEITYTTGVTIRLLASLGVGK